MVCTERELTADAQCKQKPETVLVSVITEIFKLFGVKAGDVPACFVNKINHLLLLAKMCISKFKYGSYHDIVRLLEYEMELRGLW